MHDHRAGAKQPHPFDPARAAVLDDPARFAYLEPAAVLELLDLPAGATLVDFGTGTGMYAIEIARARPDVRVLALDENPTMLDHASQRIRESNLTNVRTIEPSDLASLHAGVDRILALNVLHELGDDVLHDLGLLLRPGGTAVIVDWSSDVDRPHGPPREHTYGVDEARARLNQSGYDEHAATTFPYHYAFVVAPVRPA